MSFKEAVFLDIGSMGKALNYTCLNKNVDHWRFYDTTSPNQTLKRINNAELVVTNKVVLDKKILNKVKKLKLICVAATGTNNIDIDTAKKQGIQVLNVAGYGTASVVQHVFALLLSLTTRLQAHQTLAVDGTWEQSSQFCVLDKPFYELRNKTIGIIGYGELGRGVAKIAKAFGMKVKVSTRPGSSKEKKADYLYGRY